ncbi:MAG: lipopolysaccharide assembly LapA domain-containing protein [Steroidobacteraceae bacterium]
MRTLFVLTLIVLATVFAVQNANIVTIVIYLWRVEASLAVVIAVCFAAGGIVAAIVLVPSMVRRHVEAKRLRTQIASLNTQSDIPITMHTNYDKVSDTVIDNDLR